MSREFRTVAAARGMRWFQGAIGMLDRNPRGLLLTALVFVVIEKLPSLLATLQPLAGMLALAVLLITPALMGGLMHAIAEADEGRPVSVGQLFEAFRRPGVVLPMLVLGMLSILGLFALGYAANTILGPDNIAILAKVAAQQLKPEDVPMDQLEQPLLRFLMAAAVILFVLLAGLFFAVPRVLFDRRPALAAFLESFVACAANVLSLTLYGLALTFAVFVLLLVLAVAAVLLGVLGQLGTLLGFLIFPPALMLAVLVSAAGNYLAWREVFGHVDADADKPPIAGIAV